MKRRSGNDSRESWTWWRWRLLSCLLFYISGNPGSSYSMHLALRTRATQCCYNSGLSTLVLFFLVLPLDSISCLGIELLQGRQARAARGHCTTKSWHEHLSTCNNGRFDSEMIRVKSLWVWNDCKTGTRSTRSLHNDVMAYLVLSTYSGVSSNNWRFDSEIIRVKSLEVLKTAITKEDSIPKYLEVEDNSISLERCIVYCMPKLDSR